MPWCALPHLQRGSKRHPPAAAVTQAYTGAAVGRTATGQFAPAINASKRRRVEGGSTMAGCPAAGLAGDAEYPGLPAGMARPSLQVGQRACKPTPGAAEVGELCARVRCSCLASFLRLAHCPPPSCPGLLAFWNLQAHIAACT